MRSSRAALMATLAALVLAGCAQPARTPAELAALRARSPNPPAQPFVPPPPPIGVSSVPGERAAAAATPDAPRPPALAALPAPAPGTPVPGPDAAPLPPDQAAVPPPAPPPAPAPTPAATATPRPGLGREERRVPVDSATAPWRSIGMVTAEGGGRCTGAVIGPRTVLTAAHCVVHPRTGQPLEPQNVQYVIGPTG